MCELEIPPVFLVTCACVCRLADAADASFMETEHQLNKVKIELDTIRRKASKHEVRIAELETVRIAFLVFTDFTLQNLFDD